MLQFIVLGYIPGTSIQLNFFSYLLGLSLVAVLMGAIWYYNARTMRRAAQQMLFSLMAL